MNILQKIQNLVMSVETFEFASYELANGTKIECDTPELEVGSIISVVKEDGKELAPSGEHVLTDGRTIVLDDSAKVTEIKESDAPTETKEENLEEQDEEEKKKEEEEMKKNKEKMAMETDPELVQAVLDMLKAKVSGVEETEMQELANSIVYAMTAYDQAKDMMNEDEDSVENGIVTNTTTSGYSAEFSALAEIVLEMAKKQEEMSTKLSKVPTGKAISEMEFGTEDSATDNLLEARIAAIKNLNK